MQTKIVAVCCSVMLAVAAAHLANAKTAKECAAEWTANKATIQASGKTRAKFVAECRATDASGAQTTTTEQTKSETKTKATTTTTTETGANRYGTEADAKSHCTSDTVVWVNLRTKVFHASGDRSYGKTKRGTYMCEKDATSAGFRAPKTRAKKS